MRRALRVFAHAAERQILGGLNTMLDRLDLWVSQHHLPENVGTAEHPIPMCLSLAHRVAPLPWPCPDWLAATDRIDERSRG